MTRLDCTQQDILTVAATDAGDDAPPNLDYFSCVTVTGRDAEDGESQ